MRLHDAPTGTRAPAIGGGWWFKMGRGWKWNGPGGKGGTYPSPGGDWTGKLLPPTVAALYVEAGGCYDGVDGVDAWDIARDARTYSGPYPVVAHPPCQRWGRFWHGSTRKPHQFKLGDDGGCFKAALEALQKFGGVLEHPCDSHAWRHFGLRPPKRFAGWMYAGGDNMWTCYVEQGHYGHMSRKPTWLLAKLPPGVKPPELNWSKGEQRLHPTALARYGYEKARRIGMTAMVGGKRKTEIRNATPTEFRDVLLGIARLVELETV